MAADSSALPLPWINIWDVPNAVRSRNKVLARIPRGTPVEILEWQSEGWARVRVESPAGPLFGWVHGSFLSRSA